MATIKEILGDAFRDDMTVAEVIEATKAMNLVDLTTGQYVSIGKYNSAVAERDDYKAKYTSTLDDAQRAEIARQEQEKRYAEIEKQNSIYRYTEKLSGTISDKEVLTEVATLWAEGKIEEALDAQTQYFAKVNQKSGMQNNPQASAQNGGSTPMTREQIMAIKDPTERQLAIQNNLQLFQSNKRRLKKWQLQQTLLPRLKSPFRQKKLILYQDSKLTGTHLLRYLAL